MSNERITDSKLEKRLAAINKIIKQDYELEYAYGGQKMVIKGGGADVLDTGFVSKRELFNHMVTFQKGLRVMELIKEGQTLTELIDFFKCLNEVVPETDGLAVPLTVVNLDYYVRKMIELEFTDSEQLKMIKYLMEQK